MSNVVASLNRLTKWRTVLAGWQLGTRPKGDPESDAVRDSWEAQLILRTEVTALVALLIEKQVFSRIEWEKQVAFEAEELQRALERRFVGVQATDSGLIIHPEAAEWMQHFRP
jgi:hypothetical protein